MANSNVESGQAGDGVWDTHLGYWQVESVDQERLVKKRNDAARLLGDKAVLVLFSGEQSEYGVGRFYAEPWFRDFAELRESGCALMCAQGVWTLYVPEPTQRSMVWEGYRLGSNRAQSALGIDAKPIDAFEEDFKNEVAGALRLAIVESDQSSLAKIAREAWAAAAHGRARPRGVRSMLDAATLLEDARLIADESGIERLRASSKIAALGHLSAWEALFRAVAKTQNAKDNASLDLADCAQASRGADPSWEAPALGMLAKAMLESGLAAPLSERLLEGAFLGMCAACGADEMAYSPIVAAGENAICLHWNENRRRIIEDDWVLMDMGCSYEGFASDLTRTVPANGRFDGLRGMAYRILLEAQLAGVAACTEGAPFDAAHKACQEVLINRLPEIGALRQEWADPSAQGDWRISALSKVFPHSTSHFIGRQVHDIGSRRTEDGESLVSLKAGMRLTVEPGVYFYPTLPGLPEELVCFGARIEDVCLVAPGGAQPEVLTALCPKTVEEIQAFARECGLD